MIITGPYIVHTTETFLIKPDFDNADSYRKIDSRVDWSEDSAAFSDYSETIALKSERHDIYRGAIKLSDIVFETDVFCINVPEILNLAHPITIWITPVYTKKGYPNFLIRKYHLPPMKITLSYEELSEMFAIGISDALTSLLNKIPYMVDPIQMLENADHK